MTEVKKEHLEPEKDVSAEEAEEKEKILRLAEAWSEEELSQHFRQPAEEVDGFNPEKELAEISAKGGSASRSGSEDPSGSRTTGGKNQVRRAPVYEQRRLKRDLIREFKEKFINQRQGLAELIVQLEDFIRSNPDAAKDDLSKLVSEKASIYQLNQEQVEQFQKTIEVYNQKHQTIQKYARYYQERFRENWQKEFFKDLYGSYPVGQIDLKIGPVTLCWIYKDRKDGALILAASKEYAARLIGARADKKVNLSGLEGVITAINFQKAPEAIENTEIPVKKHEEFHTIDYLFFSLARLREKFEQLKQEYFKKREAEKNTAVIYKLIEQFISQSVHETRKIFQNSIKSEILARLKGGSKDTKEIFIPGILEIKLLGLGSYKYFERKLFKRKNVAEALTNIVAKYDPTYKNFGLEIAQKKVEEEKGIYERSMVDGLAALRELAKIHPYDCDRNKLVALLSIEPLAKWPRLAKIFEEIKEPKV